MSEAYKLLRRSAAKGDVAGIKAALGMGASVKFVDWDGDSILCVASFHGHADAIAAVVAAGAGPNVISNGRFPLHCASFMGHLKAVEVLLSAGADPTVMDRDGLQPMDVVCMWARDGNGDNAPDIKSLLRAATTWWRRRVAVTACVLALG